MRLLLYPFSFCYGLVVVLRNFFYDSGIFPSVKFNLPVILVGNLSTGGTGKTPHTEYLIRLLSGKYRVATLSRGYGRQSKGFREVTLRSSVNEAGDEPLLYKTRHPELTVTVCENRAEGIRTIIKQFPNVQVILMDDGFQHRRVVPGFKILLTSWQRPFYKDHLLPAGNLREPVSGKRRADCLIVTKTPDGVEAEKKSITRKVRMHEKPVLFSSLTYGHPKPVFTGTVVTFPEHPKVVILFAGIADAGRFVEYVTARYVKPDIFLFGDHHEYTPAELDELAEHFQTRMLNEPSTVLLTTEKDAMRLRTAAEHGMLKELPVFYVPVDILLPPEDQSVFDELILNYVETNKSDS
ncbi:MAG TPA: tetraacyldisaccharide 4'-kinase [Bacteroidia bacterium]|nr:tetraacyldisaccharide 4'-kinase [Bacteroidia bacterium]